MGKENSLEASGYIVSKSDSPRRDDRDRLLYPQSRYQGKFTPENLAFNSNLQEFAQKVSYICALETGGKISPDQAYRDVKALWKELKVSKKELKIREDSAEEES
ncbi:hypothetical protein C1752_03956 [Acaryochloris thomasi RCC1774]|uniref:Isopropylmalate/homocitrate/citramalate synthases n=1 Tax=Acaryochloris thomasi RCC1774 TaxID=1764569 RepID=A0A2W1JT86_9CYAN|nr:hypothetical protein C1752_03956 [Acaryochloris thomasi RCC1774]